MPTTDHMCLFSFLGEVLHFPNAAPPAKKVAKPPVEHIICTCLHLREPRTNSFNKS